MEFDSYEKMPERLSALNLDLAETKKLDKATWVLSEKIHGANFSFILSSDGIAYAKRKELLAWNDDFFAFQRVAERLQATLFQLLDLLGQDYSFEKAQLYGELFGGAYPHPEVEAIDGLQAIQTGIYYHPDIQFAAFDLALTDSDGQRRYLPYRDLMDYCEKLGLFYATPLLIGSLQQVLQFDTHIHSTIPAQFDLPPLDDFNLIEGVVIKPIDDLIVATKKGDIRPILKIKNPEFSEEERFGEAQKWSYLVATDNDAILFYVDELGRFLNKNRLEAAISKIGHPNSPERREQLRQLLWEDMLHSYQAQNPTIAMELLTELRIAYWPVLMQFMEKQI